MFFATASKPDAVAFQCSSASRKFLNSSTFFRFLSSNEVSVLFSEPKIPQCNKTCPRNRYTTVSVLFSEPKIPQLTHSSVLQFRYWRFQCSSASRKFLNALSHTPSRTTGTVSVLFSEPKIPQLKTRYHGISSSSGFSALQRAENSSIPTHLPAIRVLERFSALQRAENSSILTDCLRYDILRAQFQCSSASRKFLNWRLQALQSRALLVSVLFSEPKIPQ